jgi:hypothetical protein
MKNIILSMSLMLLSFFGCDVNSPKFIDNGPLTTLIYSYDIKEGKLSKIADSMNPIYYPVINSFAYTQSKGGLTLIDAETKRLKVIAPIADIWDFAISKDGLKFAFCPYQKSDTDLYLVDLDGTNLKKIIATPTRFESHPSFSSNGQYIVYNFSKDDFNTRGIAIYDLKSSTVKIIKEVKKPFSVGNANFLNNDNSILYIETELLNSGGEIKYNLRLINISDLSDDKILDDRLTNYTLSSDNKIIFSDDVKNLDTFTYSYHMFLYEISTKNIEDLGVGNVFNFSADGEDLIFLAEYNKNIITIKNLTDKSTTYFDLGETDFWVSVPFLSKDKSKIYFSARPLKSTGNY